MSHRGRRGRGRTRGSDALRPPDEQLHGNQGATENPPNVQPTHEGDCGNLGAVNKPLHFQDLRIDNPKNSLGSDAHVRTVQNQPDVAAASIATNAKPPDPDLGQKSTVSGGCSPDTERHSNVYQSPEHDPTSPETPASEPSTSPQPGVPVHPIASAWGTAPQRKGQNAWGTGAKPKDPNRFINNGLQRTPFRGRVDVGRGRGSGARGRGRGENRPQETTTFHAGSNIAVGGTVTSPHSTSAAAQRPAPSDDVISGGVVEMPDWFSEDKFLTAALPTERTRFKRGTVGDHVRLLTNHVRVALNDDITWFHYRVDFEPDHLDNKRLRFRAIKDCADLFQPGDSWTFDGGSKLILGQKIDRDKTYKDVATAAGPVRVKLEFICELAMTSPDYVAHINTVFHNFQERHLRMTQIGKDFYDMSTARPVALERNRVEIVSGFEVTLAPYDGGMLMQSDVSHKLLRIDTALDVINRYDRDSNDPRRQAASELTGAIIITKHNNNTYRVHDVDWDQNPLSSFNRSDNTQMTYADYFKTQYNISVRDLNQPLLYLRSKKKSMRYYIPAELCHLTGLTSEHRKDFILMRQIQRIMRVPPSERVDSLKRWKTRLHSHSRAKSALSVRGLVIDNRLMTVDARVLPPCLLQLGGGARPRVIQETDWSRELRDRSTKILAPVDMTRWVVLCMRGQKVAAEQFANDVMDMMCARTGKPIRMVDAIVEVPDERTMTWVRTVRDYVLSCYPERPQMVVCLWHGEREDRYSAVKHELECGQSAPLRSQVILTNTLRKQKSYNTILTNIVDQIQFKLGADLWRTLPPTCANWPQKVMFMGMDTFHDTRATDRRSVVTSVATRGPTTNQVRSGVAFQPQGKEINENAHKMTGNCVAAFATNTKALPEVVVIFRDGVGDGQIDAVLNVEVSEIRRGLADITKYFKKKVGKNDLVEPKLVVIIVKKRITARFFKKQGSGYENPAPGTVVDNTVTSLPWPDFFLISQKVGGGTVSPTHYRVIVNDSDLTVDQLQMMTYYQCHGYYNWPGAIATPAVCKMADRLAQHVGQFLHEVPHNDLLNTMFFM